MPWTAPPLPEALLADDGPTTGPERPILVAYHRWQRAKLWHACAGLTAEQLVTAAVPPSSLTLLGLVRHLAKVERTWWRIRLAREDVAPLYPPGADDDFDLLDPAAAPADFEALLAEWAACDAVAAQYGLDEQFGGPGHVPDEPMSVRMLYVHLVGEYAQHNGHADLLRERVLAAVVGPPS